MLDILGLKDGNITMTKMTDKSWGMINEGFYNKDATQFYKVLVNSLLSSPARFEKQYP